MRCPEFKHRPLHIICSIYVNWAKLTGWKKKLFILDGYRLFFLNQLLRIYHKRDRGACGYNLSSITVYLSCLSCPYLSEEKSNLVTWEWILVMYYGLESECGRWKRHPNSPLIFAAGFDGKIHFLSSYFYNFLIYIIVMPKWMIKRNHEVQICGNES